MALSANTVFEVRTTGSDTNGGGFVTGASGTDWSQQNTAQYAVTDGVTAGTTTITSATASFGTDVVGNLIYVSGGTGSVVGAQYQITARTNATTITVDRSTGLTAGTGVTLNIGGALASIGMAATQSTTGQIVYVKNGTYTISTASTNVSGGAIGGSINQIYIGYSSTRTFTNTGTKPVISFGASTISLFTARSNIINLSFDGNAQTAAKLTGGSESTFVRCYFTGLNTASASSTFVQCESTVNSATVFVGNCYSCVAHDNTATGFSGGSFFHCISYGNTGASTDGFSVASVTQVAANCTAYNNARDGFTFRAGFRSTTAINCYSEGNAGFGFYTTSVQDIVMVNCSAYNNVSGDYGTAANTFYNEGFVSVTVGSALTNAASGDFSLNNTVSRGALLRGTGYPASFPLGLTTSYLDIGTAQHQDTPTTYTYNMME